MPRVRRRGHTRRDDGLAVSEWDTAKLEAEYERLKNDGEADPWDRLADMFRVGDELDRRRRATCHE
jgi:hypothetical protein